MATPLALVWDLIARDKVPANVGVLTRTDFDHTKSSDFLSALEQKMPGVALVVRLPMVRSATSVCRWSPPD